MYIASRQNCKIDAARSGTARICAIYLLQSLQYNEANQEIKLRTCKLRCHVLPGSMSIAVRTPQMTANIEVFTAEKDKHILHVPCHLLSMTADIKRDSTRSVVYTLSDSSRSPAQRTSTIGVGKVTCEQGRQAGQHRLRSDFAGDL